MLNIYLLFLVIVVVLVAVINSSTTTNLLGPQASSIENVPSEQLVKAAKAPPVTTLTMNGTDTGNGRYKLTVPKTWGTSGSITVQNFSFKYEDIGYTLVTADGPTKGFLKFNENDLGLFYGLPIAGLGLIITSKHIGAREASNVVNGQNITEGLIMCMFPSVLSAKTLAGKTYTSFNYLQPDQKSVDKGITVGWTSFKATSGLEVSNSSLILGASSNPTIFYQNADPFVIAESQNKPSILTASNSLEFPRMSTPGRGFSATQNASALNIGWNMGDAYAGGFVLKPGNFFAVPQEKLSNFNPYYTGKYKVVCMGTTNKFTFGAQVAATEPLATDRYLSFTGTFDVQKTTSSLSNCNVLNMTAITSFTNNAEAFWPVSQINGTYSPISTSSIIVSATTPQVVHPNFTKNRLPGTFIMRSTTTTVQPGFGAFADAFSITSQTTLLTTIAFAGSATKQKYVVFSIASSKAVTNVGSGFTAEARQELLNGTPEQRFLYGIGTAI